MKNGTASVNCAVCFFCKLQDLAEGLSNKSLVVVSQMGDKMPLDIQDLENEQNIWRYLDDKKFNLLIQDSSLYFSRIDLFTDGFEGSLGRENYLQRKYTKYLTEDEEDKVKATNKKLKRFYLANCWHISDCETPSMWGVYSKGTGVAIQTTVGDLKKSFYCAYHGIPEFPHPAIVSEDERIEQFWLNQFKTFAKVNYVNYEMVHITEEIEWERFFYKEQSHFHENEYRILIDGIRMGLVNSPLATREGGFINKGQNVKVCLQCLIKKVVVHPDTDYQTLMNIKEKLIDCKLNLSILNKPEQRPYY